MLDLLHENQDVVHEKEVALTGRFLSRCLQRLSVKKGDRGVLDYLAIDLEDGWKEGIR